MDKDAEISLELVASLAIFAIVGAVVSSATCIVKEGFIAVMICHCSIVSYVFYKAIRSSSRRRR